tara:strand:+ start:387 stop:500 length:114 start_codon:yes stop_codon:yes gene_type:complete
MFEGAGLKGRNPASPELKAVHLIRTGGMQLKLPRNPG